MNWSTRLRRWVRIRTPPVRVASMKPTAATVLPAPVACSNQKRRAAPGSSGASSTTSSSSSGPGSDPVLRLLVFGRFVFFVAFDVGVVGDRDFAGRRLVGADFARAQLDPRLGGADLLLGHQLGQRAGERVDLVRGQLGAVAQGRRLDREEALEPEQHRVIAAPLDRGMLGPGGQLLQRGVERLPPGGAGSERLGPLAVEQEGLTGECRCAIDVVARWDCRVGGNGGVGHRRLWFLPRPQTREDSRKRGWNEASGVGCYPSPEYSLRSANREPNVSVL